MRAKEASFADVDIESTLKDSHFAVPEVGFASSRNSKMANFALISNHPHLFYIMEKKQNAYRNMKEEQKNHFDSVAAEWDANMARNELTEAIAKAIESMCCLTSEMSVLEYGCGTGTLSMLLSAKVAKIVAMDSSKGMIEQVEKKIIEEKVGNIKAVQLDLSGEVDLDEKFDLIVTSMTMHHVDSLDTLLNKLVSMLSETGHIFIADLCEEDGSFHGDTEMPHHGFNPDTLGNQLVSAGMKSYTWEVVHAIEKNDRVYDVFGVCAKWNLRV